MNYIYGLIDPRTDEIRYIGKSKNPTKRVQGHIDDAHKGGKYHRCKWLRELLALELKPCHIILQSLQDSESWQDAERWWIAEGRKQGWLLTNETSGGEGAQLSAEAMERMRQSKRGQSPPNKGVPMTDEVKQKVSAAKMGCSAWNKGMTGGSNPEHSARMKGRPSPNKGKEASEETRRKLSESHKGKTYSEEAHQKQSASQQARRERERLERESNGTD